MGNNIYDFADKTYEISINDVKPYSAVWIKWGNVPEQAAKGY